MKRLVLQVLADPSLDVTINENGEFPEMQVAFTQEDSRISGTVHMKFATPGIFLTPLGLKAGDRIIFEIS
jgi:hypothetical protein